MPLTGQIVSYHIVIFMLDTCEDFDHFGIESGLKKLESV